MFPCHCFLILLPNSVPILRRPAQLIQRNLANIDTNDSINHTAFCIKKSKLAWLIDLRLYQQTPDPVLQGDDRSESFIAHT
jgi:hypothetical protein